MNDTAPIDPPPSRPSIALTTPFLSLAAAVVALAAFLLGYVVKDLASGHGAARIAVARMSGPVGMEHGHGAMPALPKRGLADVTAGKVASVDGNTVTLTSPDGKTVKVTLDKDAFVVVRKASPKDDLGRSARR